MLSSITVPWAPLGPIDPRALKPARLQAHWAAQIIAPVGATLVPPEDDYGHTALEWKDDLGLLVSRAAGQSGFRAGLRIADLTVLVLDPSGEPAETFSLEGRTLEEGLAWLTAAVGRMAGEPFASPLTLVGYTMEPHPVKDGAAFSVDGPALATIERWYRNAARLLAAVRTAVPEAGEVRIWPHHFDIATLATFDRPEIDAEDARSLGFGLSPGDDAIPEPYWYLLPWPVPPKERRAPLAVGTWHTDGFVGAVLTGAHDERTVARFFASAAEVSRRAIGVDPA